MDKVQYLVSHCQAGFVLQYSEVQLFISVLWTGKAKYRDSGELSGNWPCGLSCDPLPIPGLMPAPRIIYLCFMGCPTWVKMFCRLLHWRTFTLKTIALLVVADKEAIGLGSCINTKQFTRPWNIWFSQDEFPHHYLLECGQLGVLLKRRFHLSCTLLPLQQWLSLPYPSLLSSITLNTCASPAHTACSVKFWSCEWVEVGELLLWWNRWRLQCSHQLRACAVGGC